MDVKLYVYDLSKGLARQFSRQFLGTHIDAVYHTAVVFEGVEYFFGAGVQTAYAGSTHHGQPMEIVDLGKTQLPIEVILEYLESLKRIYTAESYDLFMHNCNNFSNDFAMFLVGRGIPDHITSLPQRVLETPFGQMLKPQLDQAMRGVTQAPVPPQAVPQIPVEGRVQNVTTLDALDRLLQSASHTCAVIFFTSSTCAPCKVLYPTYDELAAEAKHRAVLIKVDINNAPEIATRYGVRATPTIMTFLKGEVEEKWSGADVARLRGSVRLLIESAHPTHPHMILRVPHLQREALVPAKYVQVPPLDKVVAKLGPYAHDPTIVAVKDFISAVHNKVPQESPLPPLPKFGLILQASVHELPPDSLFAAFDLLRLAIADPRVASFFIEEPETKTLNTVLHHVNSFQPAAPYSLRIVSLKLACNIFASPMSRRVALELPNLRKELIELVTTGLLDETHENVRVAAATLAFNLASANHHARIKQQDDALLEHEQVEIAAGIIEAINREKQSKDIIKRLVLALGLLAYCAPVEGEVLDVCRALEAFKAVEAKESLCAGDMAIHEIQRELLGKGL
ncbi:DUF862-domain-containing protein [Trichodelitschia bisporula]|uniref:DUF862-domain-containing protein n=1 Tax=Trichodelitschia bisporula TaxID=703511 RepID=A0A6G1HRM5_9PEZI|nr:DUF862-domain-containing protein [Trichodelitschia bisporula]